MVQVHRDEEEDISPDSVVQTRLEPKRLREVLFAFHYVYKVRTNATGKMELGGAITKT